jgi:hypothetical protein
LRYWPWLTHSIGWHFLFKDCSGGAPSIRASVPGLAREALDGVWRARLQRAPPPCLVERTFFEWALEKEAPTQGVLVSLVF